MSSSEAPRATRREWLGLLVIALPCALYAMDLTVLNLAVPRLSEDLKPSASQLLWIVDIYGFMVAGFLITMGTLGDRIGRRLLLLIGAVAFGAASILAAFSTTPEMLIVARAILGIAGATIAPSTLSLIRNMFVDENERTVAVGYWVASYSVGGAIGPVIGGLLLQYFWWGSVFLLAIPVMIVLLIAGPMLLPEYKDPKAGRLDLVSAAMSLVAILALILGLKQFAESGLGWMPILSVLVGLGVGALFVMRQRRLSDPLIDITLFRLPVFSGALVLYMLSAVVLFGAFLLVAQYLQLILGLSPFESALWMLPSGLTFVVGSVVMPWFVSRFRPAHLMAAGFLSAAIGAGLMTQVQALGIAALVAGFVLQAIGFLPIVTLATVIIIGAAPPEKAGAASAISETSAELGGALGIAVLGSLSVLFYRSMMAEGLPAGTPADVAAAAMATLGGAVAVAAEMSGSAGEALLAAARAAFTQSVIITVAISATVSVIAAIIALVMLRKAEPPSETAGAEA